MSNSEFEGPVVEQRSSVKISMNAKGEAQVEVKAYEGVEGAELERIRLLAVAAYNQTAREVRFQTGPPAGDNAA